MKEKDVDFFEMVKAHLQQLQKEVGALSKAKPDNPINKFKLGFINEKIGQANLILVGEFKPFKTFELFDEDDLPTNSDVVMVLSQYLDCLEAWRSANVCIVNYVWRWNIADKNITAQPPTRHRIK